jgi:hypothetical protein
VLEVLRQPLEQGVVTIARALRSTTFPARFVLVAAMNPCPCGYLGDPRHACKCSGPLIERYLDRIDLHIEVPAVPFEELSSTADGTASASMREQVTRARAVQPAASSFPQLLPRSSFGLLSAVPWWGWARRVVTSGAIRLSLELHFSALLASGGT